MAPMMETSLPQALNHKPEQTQLASIAEVALQPSSLPAGGKTSTTGNMPSIIVTSETPEIHKGQAAVPSSTAVESGAVPACGLSSLQQKLESFSISMQPSFQRRRSALDLCYSQSTEAAARSSSLSSASTTAANSAATTLLLETPPGRRMSEVPTTMAQRAAAPSPQQIRAIHERLLVWWRHYSSNPATADVFVRAVSLSPIAGGRLRTEQLPTATVAVVGSGDNSNNKNTAISTSLIHTPPPSPIATPTSAGSPRGGQYNKTTIRVRVTPRSRARDPFILRRDFDIEALRATLPTPQSPSPSPSTPHSSASHGTTTPTDCGNSHNKSHNTNDQALSARHSSIVGGIDMRVVELAVQRRRSSVASLAGSTSSSSSSTLTSLSSLSSSPSTTLSSSSLAPSLATTTAVAPSATISSVSRRASGLTALQQAPPPVAQVPRFPLCGGGGVGGRLPVVACGRAAAAAAGCRGGGEGAGRGEREGRWTAPAGGMTMVSAARRERERRDAVGIHLEVARLYLPVVAAILYSGHVSTGDIIDLPMPHPEVWKQTVQYLYDSAAELTEPMRENIRYLAGRA